MTANRALYPIREVSRLTGVNAITLRAWERRYGLIEPVRTDSGHRLYTDEHIELIKRSVDLTQQGIPISQVKALLDQQIEVEHLTQMAELDELDARLDLSLQGLDSNGLQQAIDSVFIELDERSALHLLLRTDLKIQHPEQKIIWSSVLLPRLYSRLRFAQKALTDSAQGKPVLLLPSVELESSLTVAFAAIWLVQQGLLPLFALKNMPLPDNAQLNALHCRNVLFLVQNDLAEVTVEPVDFYPAVDCVILRRQPRTPSVEAPFQQLDFSELFNSKAF